MNLTYKVRDEAGNWITIDQEQFNSISLEGTGTRLPDLQGFKIILSTYTNTFHGYLMGVHAFRVYMILSQFLWSKDYSYPSLSLLSDMCGMSINTVKKALVKLEEMGLILQVQVINRKGEYQNNLYMVRKSIALLTIDQYKQLPKRLQEQHDKFISNLDRSDVLMMDIPDYKDVQTMNTTSVSSEGVSSDDIPVDIVDNVDKSHENDNICDIPSEGVYHGMIDVYHEMTDGVYHEVIKNKYKYTNNYKYNNKNISAIIKECVKSRLPEQSFETWMKSIHIESNDKHMRSFKMICQSEFQKEWLEERYITMFKDVFADLGLSESTFQFVLE